MTLWDQYIDYIRQVQNQNMPDRCTIRKPIEAPNGRGGISRTFETWETLIPCRFWISSGASGTSTESAFRAERETAVTDAFIIVAWDAKVDDTCFVDWYSSEDQNVPGEAPSGTPTRTFRVTGMNKSDTIHTATRLRVVGERAFT